MQKRPVWRQFGWWEEKDIAQLIVMTSDWEGHKIDVKAYHIFRSFPHFHTFVSVPLLLANEYLPTFLVKISRQWWRSNGRKWQLDRKKQSSNRGSCWSRINSCHVRLTQWLSWALGNEFSWSSNFLRGKLNHYALIKFTRVYVNHFLGSQTVNYKIIVIIHFKNFPPCTVVLPILNSNSHDWMKWEFLVISMMKSPHKKVFFPFTSNFLK